MNVQLYHAASMGNLDRVKHYLAAGANIESRVELQRRTPLFAAAMNGHTEIVELLLGVGANIETQDIDQRTPLLAAASNGHLEIVEMLLQARANIEARGRDRRTPLFAAARNGHKAIVEMLLGAGANIEAQDINQRTPLLVAAMNGHTETVEHLLSAGANSEAQDEQHRTPLFAAAMNGRPEIVERLLTAGANIEAQDDQHRTPLFIAAANGHTAIIERLMAKGANIETQDINQRTLLFAAAMNGRKEIVEFLLHVGVNIETHDVNQATPLFMAAANGHKDIVERLLNAGANIETKDLNQATPLYMAAANGRKEIVEHLLTAGANIDIKDVNQATPLYVAAMNCHTEIVERLLTAGANIETQTVNQLSPLLIAATNGCVEVVKQLLAAGADPNKKNKEGKTVLDIAKENRNTDIIRLFGPKWKGWNRSDVAFMNKIFETEPVVVEGEVRKPPCNNWSCCPVCLAYSERTEGCMYMKHNCTALGGSYHKELYEKYKEREGYLKGNIYWCTICGRICDSHKHYSLSPAEGPTASVINVINGVVNVFGEESGCIRSGGGGLNEKVMRFRRMREYALELHSQIDKIPHEDAIRTLVEEAWNAPLAPPPGINIIRREKKWNSAMANNVFPAPPTAVTAAETVEAVAAANIPWAFEGIPQMVPTIHEEGFNSTMYADKPYVIQFHHRQENGTINHHEDEFVSYTTLFDKGGLLTYPIGNTGDVNFGKCPFSDCGAIMYPGELQYVLDHIPENAVIGGVSVELLNPAIRIQYQARLDNYKRLFNEKFNDRVRLEANRAAAATMPVGGAGAAAARQGQGKGRRRTRRIRHRT